MMTMSNLVDLYLTERRRRGDTAPLTLSTMGSNLRGFVSWIEDPPIDEFGREHIERWREKTKLAPSTKRTRLSQVKGLCVWAVAEGHIPRDYSAGLGRIRQPRSVPRGLKRDQVESILDVCTDTRSRLVVLLMVQEGLRRAEVATIGFTELDIDEAMVLVRGKGGHERVLPLSEETMAALHDYLDEWPATAGPLIRSFIDGRSSLSPETVGRMVSDAMLAAGVKRRAYDGKSGHALRHTAATDMVRSGAHLRDVQAALGHASIATTQRYLPWAVGDLRKAMGGRTYRKRTRPPAPTFEQPERRIA